MAFIATLQLDESSVIDTVESMTTAWRPEGEWIASLYLEAKYGGRLGVRDMGKVGECREACKTIELAAQDVMGEHDVDLAEALFLKKFKTKKQLETWLCKELTKSCASAPPSLPKGHKAYPPFKVAVAGEQNIDRVMGQMADNGLRGKVYSREELMEKYEHDLGDFAEGRDEL